MPVNMLLTRIPSGTDAPRLGPDNLADLLPKVLAHVGVAFVNDVYCCQRCSMSSTDFAWLVEHGTEIALQYAGKWIAVHNGRVIGVGETAPEAAQRAREAEPDAEFILEAVDQDADVIYGGL